MEVYTDNGITGRTFEREAFQRMLADVEAGKINCIMVKDLSRLGRNTIDTGYYIEKYFPLHGVRFIAVNDQFDSEDSENSGNHLIVPLKNMINEAYAADISKKVRAQQNQAMRDGEFVGGRPPYGYPEGPGQLPPPAGQRGHSPYRPADFPVDRLWRCVECDRESG